MGHETEFISYRPHRRAVATFGALGAIAQARRPTSQLLQARSCERNPVSGTQRVYLAQLAARSAAVSHCLSLLSALATRWNLGATACQATRARASPGGQIAQAFGCHPRQPEREDDRARRAAWLRCGEKKSSAANDILSLIRWAWSGHWSLPRPTCKIAKAENLRWTRSDSMSSSLASSGRIKRTTPRQTGPGFVGLGSSSWFGGPQVDSKFNPSVGSSNAHSAGSIAHAACPKTSNARAKAAKPSSTSR